MKCFHSLQPQKILVLLFAVTLIAAAPAHAKLVVYVGIKSLPRIINPTDTVVIEATLINTSASNENLGVIGDGIDYEIGGFASLPSGYSCLWGPDGSLQDQFEGVDLAPGESFDFVFATCDPKNGAAPLGYDRYTGELQIFKATSARPRIASSSDSIVWEVVDTPKPDISGCINFFGISLEGTDVVLNQSHGQKQITLTDADGCYQFDSVEPTDTFWMRFNTLPMP